MMSVNKQLCAFTDHRYLTFNCAVEQISVFVIHMHIIKLKDLHEITYFTTVKNFSFWHQSS